MEGMYPTLSYHLTWGGSSGSGEESWTCGLRLWNIGLTLNDSDQTWAAHGANCLAAIASVKTILQAFHTDGLMHLNPGMNINWVKLNPVGADGKQSSTLNTIELATMGTVAGNGSPGAFEMALVASLTTDVARGRGHAGRLYHPVGSLTYDGIDGRVVGTTLTTVAQRTGKLIYDINHVSTWELTGTNKQPLVYILSNRSGKNDITNTGPAYPVTGVNVGDVPDVQRRRRRGQIEARTLGHITATGTP
jgi:hypothetical protein